MTLHRKNLLLIFFASVCYLNFGCGARSGKKAFRNTDQYDFASPKVITLSQQLDEVSGIAYYAKDTSVFAIIDEEGVLFKIPLMRPKEMRQWQFGKAHDYEDIVLKDSIFYVLESNGDVEKLTFVGDKIAKEKYSFPNGSKKANEFETIYHDISSDKIVILCKQCEADKKTQLSSFALDEPSKQYQAFTTILTAPIFQKTGKDDRIKPSAAAVNPVTKELFVLSSINKSIMIYDEARQLKDVIELNPKIYKQPEGMTFTPTGDLIISNEFLLEGNGNLLLLKNKKP